MVPVTGTTGVHVSRQGVGAALAAGDAPSCVEPCEELPEDCFGELELEEPDRWLPVVGSAAELRVGVADEDSSLSDSSSSDVDPSSVPVSESVAGALVPVAGAVVVGDDGVDSSSSCCSEDDDAVVSSASVVVLDVSVPPTMADTGFCPISSIPVTMPIAITNTAPA